MALVSISVLSLYKDSDMKCILQFYETTIFSIRLTTHSGGGGGDGMDEVNKVNAQCTLRRVLNSAMSLTAINSDR